MNTIVDITTLPQGAQRLIDENGPAPLRQMAAKGIAPGLKPGEAITVVALLTKSADAALAQTARTTLGRLPAPVLNGALSGDLPPGVIDLVAPLYATDASISHKMLALPSIMSSTVAAMAARASEEVSELIATNEERLLGFPEIIEKLYMNKSTRMSTADRIIELAVRNKLVLKGIPAFEQAAAAIANELIPEATEEPSYDDIAFKAIDELGATIGELEEDTHEIDPETGEERVKEKVKELAKRFEDLPISGKIRRAQLGDSKDRMLAIRDTNALVREAAVSSPALNENEVTRITAGRTAAEDVLRLIAADRDWTRSYQIKLNLVGNPRTPFVFASRLLPLLRENDLKALARSREVSGAVANAVRQHLSRKKKSG